MHLKQFGYGQYSIDFTLGITSVKEPWLIDFFQLCHETNEAFMHHE